MKVVTNKTPTMTEDQRMKDKIAAFEFQKRQGSLDGPSWTNLYLTSVPDISRSVGREKLKDEISKKFYEKYLKQRNHRLPDIIISGVKKCGTKGKASNVSIACSIC